ncbi:hypothetical protein F4823DRAFT_419182 [Ustulina deusta]|nr:hypothetical protein F4823DRAFT_419182 [Ustulina deusta]
MASSSLPGLFSPVTSASSFNTNSSGQSTPNLATGWSNPSNVGPILFIIAGDIVHKALAQGTATRFTLFRFTPICFSFGIVTYVFTALVGVLGEGRLLPQPDYPARVFNLKYGYARQNKNWLVGRLLRDLETKAEQDNPLTGMAGLRITIWKVPSDLEDKRSPSPKEPSLSRPPVYSKELLFAICCILLQITIASIPGICQQEWDTLAITAAGTLLVQSIGWLPQWAAEKSSNRPAKDIYAITRGNGHRDIVVILPSNKHMNLEELATSESPRQARPWQKLTGFGFLARRPQEPPAENETETQVRVIFGHPAGFFITRIVLVVASVLSIPFLIQLAMPRRQNWYIIAVGSIGAVQNAILAAAKKDPKRYDLPLEIEACIIEKKVMDALKKFHMSYPGGKALRDEFFSSTLWPDEQDWWDTTPGGKGKGKVKKGDELPKRDGQGESSQGVEPPRGDGQNENNEGDDGPPKGKKGKEKEVSNPLEG